MSVVPSFAVGAAETIPVTYELLKENPERTIGLDCYDIFENTSAEILENQGKGIYKWSFTSHVGRDDTYLGCGFVDMSSDAHSGNQALHVNLSEGQHLYVSQSGTIKAGATYEVSFWFKSLKDGGKVAMHILFSGKKAGVAQTYDRPKATFTTKVEDGWVQKTFRFIAPEYATSVAPQVRLTGPGEILMDDYTMLCITDQMPKPAMPDKLPAIKSLITEDLSFENATVGAEIHTVPQWDETIGDAKISDQYAHTGTKSVELKTEDGRKTLSVLYILQIWRKAQPIRFPPGL